MIFSSSIFLFIFLPIVLLVYFAIPKKYIGIKNIILLISSLLFYAYGEPKFVFVMGGSIVCNYFFGLLISKCDKKKLILLMGIAANLSIIGIFKYLNFVIYNLNTVINLLGIEFSIVQTQIALPIGISFFTFQAISYLVDVYRQTTPVQKNLLYLGLYISFFPQLIAGPIVRYTDINKAITERNITLDGFNYGIKRFVFGLAKKVLLSNSMALVADTMWSNVSSGTSISVLAAWLGAVAYTLQIYYDFSGYSDMAIGLGRMFGFKFNENFNYPYISKSISEFWRRWHISLGSWFRDYVYFPMGGSRVTSKKKLVFNLFVVWLLTGVWHGANWTFILWGMMYFVLIAFEKLTDIPSVLNNNGKCIYQFVTLLFVVVGWVIFRSNNITEAIEYLLNMFAIKSNGIVDIIFIEQLLENKVLFIIGILYSTPIFNMALTKLNSRSEVIACISEYIIGMVLLALVISQLVLQAYNPFIYFNF